MARIEIWGGAECTVNRVGDEWFNQCDRNGYGSRAGDLEMFAALGLKKMREPVVWELCELKDRPGEYDFAAVQARVHSLMKLGIEPILGLLHHGSGPSHTSLVDPEFARKFEHYADAVARAFPQAKYFTPINEPLTTARFCGLYGYWYPHDRADDQFLRAFLNEIQATILAMRAIRKINPHAQLVQTDDLGRAQGTPACAEQVKFENDRRWLTFDLLTSRVDEQHPLFEYILSHDVTREELQWFKENPCPPDIIGINHYPLSNRFLDENVERYPHFYLSGNGKIRYTDTGLPQCRPHVRPDQNPPDITVKDLLTECYKRYSLPVAITEAHIDGAREFQMKWFNGVWNYAHQAREAGVDVRAITAWSLLGSFDWNTLCTQNRGYYESGVFDIRSPRPRPTALAAVVRDLAMTGKVSHPIFHTDRPLLVTGANGQLGRAFREVARNRNLEFEFVDRAKLDITSAAEVDEALRAIRPWAVINVAAYACPDAAETEPQLAHRTNVIGNEVLAAACQSHGISFVTFSSDMVFDGKNRRRSGLSALPYRESDSPSPLNVIGRTKAEMENLVTRIAPESLIIRTSSCFGPWDEQGFIAQMAQRLARDEVFNVADDIIISPTYLPDLVSACLDLLIDGLRGIVHLSNNAEVSWAEFAREAANVFSMPRLHLIRNQSAQTMGFAASRPAYSALTSERVSLMPDLDSAFDRCKFTLKHNAR